MINNKKKIHKLKTEMFLNEFPIILLLQQNNLTVNDWFDFRQKIQELCDNSQNKSIDFSMNIEILNVKNTLLKKILLTSHSNKISNSCEETLKFLCQGPNFLIGCKSHDDLNSIWSLINSNSKLIFISCLYKNQLLNHLDLEILLKTNLSIYQNLFQNLDKKTEFYNTLQNPLQLQPLMWIQSNLITIFHHLKQSKIINNKDNS